MALWLVRAGRHGEREDFALENNVVVIGWDGLKDLSAISSRDELVRVMAEVYPDEKPKARLNYASQIWAFVGRIQEGDWVVLPLKKRSAIAIGQITGGYKYEAGNPEGARHTRPVKWLDTDIPRSRFDQDILYSFGAFMTVCQVRRNNAEERVKAVVEGKTVPLVQVSAGEEVTEPEQGGIDLEQIARDQIRELISRKFRGHDLSHLVAAILEAQGYKVLESPPGADGGVDILAGKGPMGFDPPRLAVQVKSSDSALDVTVLRELQGVMSNFGAEQGMIVSWGGYKQSVLKEASRLFFQVRLWDSDDLVRAVQNHFEELSDELQAEMPLKRLWVVAGEED